MTNTTTQAPNRYDELDRPQQHMVDRMINSIASGRNLITATATGFATIPTTEGIYR